MLLQIVLSLLIQQSRNWPRRFAEKIRREQSKFEIDINQLLQGHQPKQKKACYRKLDERISRIVHNYDPLQISQYLKNIAVNLSLQLFFCHLSFFL